MGRRTDDSLLRHGHRIGALEEDVTKWKDRAAYLEGKVEALAERIRALEEDDG